MREIRRSSFVMSSGPLELALYRLEVLGPAFELSDCSPINLPELQYARSPQTRFSRVPMFLG